MPQSLPKWSLLINLDSTWKFYGGKLFHREKISHATSHEELKGGKISKWIIKNCYAVRRTNHKSQRALATALSRLSGTDSWGLNLGAANTLLHSNLLNLDLFNAPNVHIISNGKALPFKDNSLEIVVAQEVLEHVEDPFYAISEILRVLKPGGIFYCQVPFVIGYHPGPTDFWRFTKESFAFLFQDASWEIQEVDQSLGHGSGFYRILVEFLAVNASCLSKYFYKPIKGISALLFFPLQFFDCLSPSSDAINRIPGGYYCVVKKK